MYVLNDPNMIESINNDTNNYKKKIFFIFISVFYIAVGSFIIGLVVTQSFMSDLSF